MKKKYVKPTVRGSKDWECSDNIVPAIVAAAASAAAAAVASAAVSKIFEEDFVSRITTDANSKVEVIYE